jgi:hypothetical protein
LGIIINQNRQIMTTKFKTTFTRNYTGEQYTWESMTIINSIQHYVLRNNKTGITVNVSIDKLNKSFKA